jgi:hypothetical protein
MHKNGDVLREHSFDVDLISFQSSLCFPEVPVSHTVTHVLALIKEWLHSKYRSESQTTLLYCSLHIFLFVTVFLCATVLSNLMAK